MESISKIQLKIGDIEVSLEGSAEFVSGQYLAVLNNLKAYSEGRELSATETVAVAETAVEETTVEPETEEPQKVGKSNELSKSFDEWLGKLSAKASGTDKILLAGYFAQYFGNGDHFRVRDASKVLKVNEVKVTNPSSLLLSVSKGKGGFIEKSETDGKQIYYRFTPKGEKHVLGLMKRRRRRKS